MKNDGEIVRFDNVGLRYGTESEVLSDIDFTLFAGRFYFLTGASGAGKTSLLRLLYLAQRPSRGAIRMFGNDVITLQARSPAGLSSQAGGRVPGLPTDRAPLRLRQCRAAAAAARDCARRICANRLPTCSTGSGSALAPTPARQRSRAASSSASPLPARSSPGPNCWWPTSRPATSIPKWRCRLLRLFEALNRLGTTVVVATHDVHLLRRVPDSLIMRLDRGRLADPTGALRYPPRRSASGRHRP